MKAARIDIGSIRREQIVDAAVAVIAEQGLQNLSLSEIEKKVGMSRGQLTYYYRAKEDILLAVFDRTLEMMCRQQGGDPKNLDDHPFAKLSWLEVIEYLLHNVMEHPPQNSSFHAVQYTFLSQISHRADFRDRLAKLYEHWRSKGSAHLQADLGKHAASRKVSPRAMSTLVQAILHGLFMQRAVDPDAFDADEIAELCLDMLTSYLWGKKPNGAKAKNTNGAVKPGGRLRANGANHERRKH